MHAAGISPSKAYRAHKGESPPAQAYRALVGWLDRARGQGRLASCDLETLASTILGALHGWALAARVCGQPTGPAAGGLYIERFVTLLWDGVGGGKP
ncbi:MAG: hypothetical protein QM765_20090 [Myxococcales bacterium]